MDPKDLEIEERLNKLRSNPTKSSNITDEELAARLAGIKASTNARQGVTDDDIAARLSNLRGNKQVPTERELEEKLAKIKGVPMPSSGSSDTVSTFLNIYLKRRLETIQILALFKS